MMETNYLIHHGVKGMKWGVRRYQNPDGSLTAAGRRRLKKTRKESGGVNSERLLAVKKKLIADRKNNQNLQKILNEQDSIIKKMIKLDDESFKAQANAKTTSEENRIEKQYDSEWGPLYDKALANEKKITSIKKEYAKKYVGQFNQERLKDVGYQGSYDEGVKYLEKVGKKFTIRYDGVIIENGPLGNMADYDWNEKRLRLHNYS